MNKKQAKECLETIFCMEMATYDIVAQFRNKEIAIYGAGTIGKNVYAQMKELGLNVVCFFDQKAKEGDTLFDLPLLKIDDKSITDEFKENTVIAFSISIQLSDKEKVIKYLKELGYKNIVSSYKLIIPYMVNGVGMTIADEQTKDKIFKVVDYLNDEHSLDIYCSNINAHYSWSYDDTLESKEMTQYFDVKVPFSKGYSCFVDLGAYNGDTIEQLLEFHQCDTYIGFEPEPNNFKLLSETTDLLQGKIKNCFLYPCATSNRNEFISFAVPGATSGRLCENGEAKVQTVCLDDVIKCDPTMLKMDVEGAEIATLKGAEKMIKRCQPDLAVCVYHYLSDIWEIPLLLRQWVPEYKFYLRAHASATMETVLYATV